MSKKKKFGVPQAVFIKQVGDVYETLNRSYLEVTEPIDLDVDSNNPHLIAVEGSWDGRQGTIAIICRTKRKVYKDGKYYLYEEVKEETEVSP